MGYRGDDLDLRTQQTWSGAPADLASASDGAATANGPRYRSDAIWVDDTLLACSNHAYDIALAHRSGDVRIEHLLHALTRIEAAAEALEARGVRVAALRRESATIIAAEIPVGLPNGKGAPRRSDEFADVLRLAGAHAIRRGDPAGVDDLLFVLLDQRPELPGLGLLSRHAPRLLPPREIFDAPRYVPEARYAQPAFERYYRIEPPRYNPEARAPRTEPGGTPVDAVQNSRIEALEQVVRGLSADLAAERQAVSGLLKDLNRTASAQRDDQDRLQSDLFDRLQSIEQVVVHARGSGDNAVGERLAGFETTLDRRVQDMAQSWTTFAARLEALEDAIRQSGGANNAGLFERLQHAIDLRPIANRLDIIEEAVLGRDSSGVDIGDRLRSLETEITRLTSGNTDHASRLDGLLTVLERRAADANPAALDGASGFATAVDGQTQAFVAIARELGERLSAVERALAGEIETTAVKHQAYAADLKDVHDALMKLNQNQHTLAGSIDEWRTDGAGDIAMISNRLANLDRDNERPIETLNALSAHMDTMNRMFIERYHRRNRFWFWLFGTDDWLGRSWPSQSAAIEADAEKTRAPDPA